MSELSDRELKFGYWYFLHRQALRRVVVVVLVLFVTAIWAYGGWQAVEWLSSRQADDEAIRVLTSNSTVNTQDYFKRHAALPLEVGTATAVPAGPGLYDLVAEVRNPNPNFSEEQLNYTFSAGTATVSGQAFFLPLEDKYLVSLGVKLLQAPDQVQLSLGEGQWHRLRDLSSYTAPAFSVSSQHLEQLPPPSSGSPAPTRLRFNLKNNSALSFWQVGVTVVLLAGSNPQAVGRQVITDVATGGTYPIELVWPAGVPPTDHLVVKPEVNVLDQATIKPAP